MKSFYRCPCCESGFISNKTGEVRCPLCFTTGTISGATSFDCPSCGHKLAAPKEFTGETFYCPGCHKAVIAPAIKSSFLGLITKADNARHGKVGIEIKKPNRLPWKTGVLDLIESGDLDDLPGVAGALGFNVMCAPSSIVDDLQPVFFERKGTKRISSDKQIDMLLYQIGLFGYRYTLMHFEMMEDAVVAKLNKPLEFFSENLFVDYDDWADISNKLDKISVCGRPWCYPATIKSGSAMLAYFLDKENENPFLSNPLKERLGDLIRQSLTSE